MSVEKSEFVKAVSRKQLRKHQAQAAIQPTVQAVKMPGGPPVPAPTCLAPTCVAAPVTRGVCANCYTSARRLIAEKITTWEVLEKLGLVNPPHVKAAKNPLIVAFYELSAKSKGDEIAVIRSLHTFDAYPASSRATPAEIAAAATERLRAVESGEKSKAAVYGHSPFIRAAKYRADLKLVGRK